MAYKEPGNTIGCFAALANYLIYVILFASLFIP